jgi:NAD(P)-dependent dehydrogenase (short-subunit alcohol dehydrogenase family)
LADVQTDRLQDVASDCPGSEIKECDVTNLDQVNSLFADEQSSILVNCAGITRDAFVTKLTEENWNDVIDVNLKGTFYTCRAFSQSFFQRQTLSQSKSMTGAIVNVGSIVSKQGNIGQVNYAASKGGVEGLTRALAKEHAGRGIRVNMVLPGFIDTEMAHAVPDSIKESVRQRIGMKRFGEAQDVANLISFLVSCERSGYITGESIECSGMISL